MTGPFADRLFRIAFALAGCYNLAFGLWAAIWPLAFFRLFELPSPRYPGIWACLGMVVGVYGLLYWHAAWKLATAWPIIAVGLLGKVLGPIGMVWSWGDDWPRRLGMVCIFNDLIWWLPFGLFLVRGTAFGRWLASRAPALCVASHAVALAVVGVWIRPGTLFEADSVARARFVAEHVSLWTAGWAMWMIAAGSFVGFCAWWGGKLAAGRTFQLAGNAVGQWTPLAAVVIAAIGMVCDFGGEGSLILLLIERLPTPGGSPHDWDSARFAHVESAFTLLSAGAANGLYTIGGIMLTLVSPDSPKWVRAAMWLTWLASIGMTWAAVANLRGGMIVSTVLLFPPFLVWVAWMAARWRRS
jgi:hypothetical protein